MHKKKRHSYHARRFFVHLVESQIVYRIISHSYPNNEIRTVFSAIPNPGEFDYEDPLELPDIALSEDSFPALVDDFSVLESCDLVEGCENLPPPLSLPPNSKTQRYSTGYGALPLKPTKFGLNAKRIVLRSGGALEKSALPEECLFLTGTLPGSTEDSFRAIAAYSAYLVNGLKAWVSNHIAAKLDFYVWEYQKRGALHLHYCVHAPDITSREFILKNFKGWWIGILHKIGDKSRCDMFKKNSNYSHRSDESKVRAIAEVCRKSPARYLAKYLTKSIQPDRGNARFFTPSRWFGVSRPLNALLKSLTKVTEIIVGSYHPVISKLEEVKYSCDTSESVTYGYKHSYGVGETIVCYPRSESENKHLWMSLEVLSTISQIESKSSYSPAIERAETVRSRFKHWLEVQLSNSYLKLQGWAEFYEEFWSITLQTIPLKFSECLHYLMVLNSRLLAIESHLKSFPYHSMKDRMMIDDCIDKLDCCMKDLIIEHNS